MYKKLILIILAVLTLVTATCTNKQANRQSLNHPLVIRVGHFPDIVHAAAMIGRNNGIFEKALGKNIKIDWKVFNAGPSVIEALFSGDIDIAYIGPGPAINGYIKSDGKALKIVCGSSSGGAGLVVRRDAGINNIGDLKGKTIATPQLGNTQDIACRAWLKRQGFEVKERSGSVTVIPVSNPDQLTLFLKKEIDCAWTKEPWVSRLIKEGNGKLFLDEREIWPDGKFVTAHIIIRSEFLKENPELVRKWIKTHIHNTDWINKNQEKAKELINNEIKNITGKKLHKDVLDAAFSRTTLTYDPIKRSLFKSLDWAYEAGFLGQKKPDISEIYDLSILNKVLKEEGLEPIE